MPKVCPHCRTEYGDEQLICPNDGAVLAGAAGGPDPLVGQVLADRYRVVRTLGEGGMGRVYLAEHVRMGRMSAVKVMHPALAPTSDAISRFNREASNASRINHPNVAAIYDFGETSDGTLYLAMEYVDGETLSSVLRREGPLKLPRAADLTRQIADALNAAHQLDIVHRDLKPDNILVRRDADGIERVKVVDFGIAKTARGGGQTVTTAGMSIGTPEYMSPEQLAGDSVDARTDIYSLGLVTFTMLTGELPHPTVTSKQSLVQRLTERPRALADVHPQVTWPPRLQRALDRALSPEPHERYSKVNDFALEVVAAAGLPAPSTQVVTREMTPISSPQIPAPAPAPATRPAAAASPVAAPRTKRGLWIGIGLAAAAAAGLLVSKSLRQETPPSIVGRADSTVSSQSGIPDSAAATPTIVPDTTAMPPVVAERQTVLVPSGRVGSNTLTASNTRPTTVRDTTQAPPRPEPVPLIPPPAITTPRPAAESALATAPTTGALTMQQRVQEIVLHANRSQRLAIGKQGPAALAELRTAVQKYQAFATDYPNARETRVVGQHLAKEVQRGVAACKAAPADSLVRARARACAELDRAAALLPAVDDGAAPQRRFQPRRARQ